MPSFDVVSEIDQHELTNAIDQMNREIGNRYDFKGSNAKIDISNDALNVEAEVNSRSSKSKTLSTASWPNGALIPVAWKREKSKSAASVPTRASVCARASTRTWAEKW